MLRRGWIGSLAVVAVVAVACSDDETASPETDQPDDETQDPAADVGLHEIQVLSTHNSYKIEPEPALLDALRAFDAELADSLEYTHRPLVEELDAGVRHIELDLFLDDPGGGRYANPVLVPQLDLEPPDPRVAEPGIKVLHTQEVDYRSTCPTLVDCLNQVRDWSDANADHLPLVVQLEAKDGEIPDPGLGFVQPLPWTADGFATIEDEIRSVFPDDDRVITPGEVKGDAPTLADAVRDDGWPTLDEARGQVMFVLDDMGDKRDAYRELRPELDDRLIFVSAAPPDDDTGVVVVNDPIADGDTIKQLAEDGFLIRTRADANTVEARSGDTARREAAWASGAHFVSTDYPFPDERFGHDYVVEVPGGGVARCNPVSASPDCQDADLAG